MTDFLDKLKEIRANEAERHRRRVGLTDQELGLASTAERCLALRGELVKDLERMMEQFVTEAPTFEIGHGFFEGKYSLALSYDEPFLDEHRGVRKHFTRVNFLLDPCAADGGFSITTKMTIRDRDLPKATLTGNLAQEAELQKFRAFAEEQMLRFATEYFVDRPKPQTVGHST